MVTQKELFQGRFSTDACSCLTQKAENCKRLLIFTRNGSPISNFRRLRFHFKGYRQNRLCNKHRVFVERVGMERKEINSRFINQTAGSTEKKVDLFKVIEL